MLRHWSTWLAQLIDDRGRIVLLLLGREPLAFVEDELLLLGGCLCAFFGLGIGVMNSARRRFSMICCVGWPCSSSSQCRAGYS